MSDITQTCLFCKIAAGEIPTKKLYEDDEVLAFWDVAPQAPQHFLIIPKKHITSLAETKEDDIQILGKILRLAAQLSAEHGIAENFRLVANTGKEAGQEVFHLHFHVLGGRKMNWPPG